ncbi:hypothetical protein [Phyllobacterium zundukense]|uniref:hypothetical protein n=1 Tax=Phyllobacterium zundukense TaxID=1867719 RepID=UPI0010561473|nr:hypothetical protein [Phyllobacterium zundukense]
MLPETKAIAPQAQVGGYSAMKNQANNANATKTDTIQKSSLALKKRSPPVPIVDPRFLRVHWCDDCFRTSQLDQCLVSNLNELKHRIHIIASAILQRKRIEIYPGSFRQHPQPESRTIA